MPHSPTSKKPLVAFESTLLLDWYDCNARLLPWRTGPAARAAGQQPDPYRVWLSEIMLQQTTIVTAGDYFRRFEARWPNVSSLAEAELNEVLAAWAGLGYYARARNLHKCARQLVATSDSIFPQNADELQDLPGIGPYTSAAIAAICWDEPVAVIDGNVERVVARLAMLKVPTRDAKPAIRATISAQVPARSGDFAQALMDLGATICTPRSPNCGICPLAKDCRAHASGKQQDFPVRAPKKPRPDRFGHAFVFIRPDGAVWLTTRPTKGLLGGMSAVPGSDWAKKEPVQLPRASNWVAAGMVIHVFTHFRLELSVWQLDTDSAPSEPGRWVLPKKFGNEALPSLFQKVLELARTPSLEKEKAVDPEEPTASA